MADHDQRFKQMLQTFFADFLRLVLGEADAARYDCTRIEWLTQEIFADPPQGERRMIDLAAKLPVSQAADERQAREVEPWLVLVHAEIESADTVEPLRKRIYDYRHELRRKYDLPVLSVGLYLSVALEGLGWDEYIETHHGQEILRFRFPYIGLPGLEAFDYVAGASLLGVALSALMRVAPDRRGELKAEALARVMASDLPELHKYLLAECIEAYLPLEGPQLVDYEQRLLTPQYGGAMQIAKTSRELGHEEGQRALFIRSLQRKFGTLPSGVHDRIAALSEDELVELNLRIGTASSLQELGLEADPGTAS